MGVWSPNFFIPENKMFLGKIYGYAQRQLFLKLYTMYETGFSSLLKLSFDSSLYIRKSYQWNTKTEG